MPKIMRGTRGGATAVQIQRIIGAGDDARLTDPAADGGKGKTRGRGKRNKRRRRVKKTEAEQRKEQPHTWLVVFLWLAVWVYTNAT